MRRRGALAGIGACLLLGSGMPAAHAAEVSPQVAACATNPDVLGMSRMVEVDATGGPQFGRVNSGGYDFLRDGEVVLTFDDGPLRAHTRAVLKALDAHCTKATFFMVGRMAVADPEMVQEVASRGHTVGAHTWSHAKLQGLSPDKAKEEIELGFSAVAQALQGSIAPFFRFPYLRPTPAAMDYLKSRDIASFTIDIDSRDFRTRDGAAVKRTVLAQLAGARKGILLFHDIQPSTAHALAGILDELKQRGFKVVHLVPKQMATTLPEYDAQADRLIAQRKVIAAKEPLATRSLTWPAAGNGSADEVLPWAHPAVTSGPDSQPTGSTNASNKGPSVPWYKQWLMP